VNFPTTKPSNFSKNFEFSNDMEIRMDSDINSVLSKEKEHTEHKDDRESRIKGFKNLSNLSKLIQCESSQRELLSERNRGKLSEVMNINDLEVNQFEIHDYKDKNYSEMFSSVQSRLKSVLENYSSLLNIKT
jgi:hypothetical protein